MGAYLSGWVRIDGDRKIALTSTDEAKGQSMTSKTLSLELRGRETDKKRTSLWGCAWRQAGELVAEGADAGSSPGLDLDGLS